MSELTLEQAQNLLLARTEKIEETEEILLWEGVGRTLAGDIFAQHDQPPFPRSPLDGYAARSRDIKGASKERPVALMVIDEVDAGHVGSRKVEEGTALRIMTGAPIPPGADCVIRQEETSLCQREPDVVLIPHSMKPYENYCFQGEDTKNGTLLLSKGEVIGSIEQGILASAGIAQAEVYRKPRIALFVSGDELCSPGEELKPGKIYDSNLWLLSGRMRELGISPMVQKMAGDDPQEIAEEIKKVIGQADMVITTGGVSVGAKDIFHQVLPLLGAKRLFWRVSMKPGTPAMFALFSGKPMLHLSGNPFAAAATFELLAVPALEKMTGDLRLADKHKKAILGVDFKKSGGRRFVRGRLERGTVTLPITQKHSSGILFSMKGCNCLVDLLPSKEPVKAGQEVDVVLLTNVW